MDSGKSIGKNAVMKVLIPLIVLDSNAGHALDPFKDTHRPVPCASTRAGEADRSARAATFFIDEICLEPLLRVRRRRPCCDAECGIKVKAIVSIMCDVFERRRVRRRVKKHESECPSFLLVWLRCIDA